MTKNDQKMTKNDKNDEKAMSHSKGSKSDYQNRGAPSGRWWGKKGLKTPLKWHPTQ